MLKGLHGICVVLAKLTDYQLGQAQRLRNGELAKKELFFFSLLLHLIFFFSFPFRVWSYPVSARLWRKAESGDIDPDP